MRVLAFERFGGPEVLQLIEQPDPVPGPHEVVIETRAIGLNFADVYRRRGSYHLVGAPPYVAGYEAAGVVVAVGPGVTGLAPGTRIAVADVPLANASHMRVPETHAIVLPDDVSFELAASLLLQGLTAQYLVEDSYPVRAGDHVLVHAAAGGVGQCLVQLARARGARVAGIVSSPAKAAAAEAAGAERCFLRDEGWVEAARAWSGDGLDAVYDAVGTTLLASLRALRDRGTAVFYGMAGGEPPAVPPRLLMDRSLRLVGGDLWSYLVSAEARRERADRLFAAVRAGALRIAPPARYPLADGAAAHAALERGETTGKIVLVP